MSKYYNDKNIFNINGIERYASGFPYDKEDKETVTLLSGKWQFHWYKSADDIPENLADEKYDVIDVPSNWQIVGYDTPIYTNITYPYAVSTKNLLGLPKIKSKLNPAGVYKKEFKAEKTNDKFFIRFNGVNSCAEVYLNGQFVGYGEDTFDFQEYDVTDLIKNGSNELLVIVYRYCTGSYLEDQDMWRLSGIFRDVYLIRKPVNEIKDFYLRGELDSEYKNAVFCADITVANPSDVQLQLTLTDNEGNKVIDGVFDVTGAVTELKIPVNDVKLWSHEIPNLYEFEARLLEKGEEVDRRKARFGFREVKIVPLSDGKGPFILLNGKPVKFRGVNRHEFHPEYGHAVPKELIKKDLMICLENNITAIRTSHYPNSAAFYDYCDEMGILVMCENNLETHGLSFMLPKNSKLWTKHCVYRVRNMVNTYKNHACIVSWSLGNESGFGNAFREMKKAVLEIDKTRFIHYEEDISGEVSDVMSEMYATLEKMPKLGENKRVRHCATTVFKPTGVSYSPKKYRDLPYIECEYAHCMGNSLGNFADYWEQFKKYDRLSGGFIWDFADQSILYRGNGKDEWRYGGDFGDEPNSGNFAFNGILRADRSPNPALHEVKKVYQMIDFAEKDNEVTVTNNYMFKTLRNCDLVITYFADGNEYSKDIVSIDDLKVGESVNHKLNLPEYAGEISVLCEVVLNDDDGVLKKGHILAFEQFELRKSDLAVREMKGNATFDESKWEVTIFEKDTRITIDKSTGGIVSIAKGDGEGSERLREPILPNFCRATIDNDRLPQINSGFVHAVMGVNRCKNAQKRLRPKNVNVRIDENNCAVVRIKWKCPLTRGLVTEYVIGTDYIDVKMNLTSRVALERYGIKFALRENITDMEFYAKGPHENYCDRKSSAILRRYNGVAADFAHDYLFPQENGNHTEARFLDLGGTSDGLLILAEEKPFEFSVHEYTFKDLDSSLHLHELEKSGYYSVYIDGMQRGVGGDIPALACLKPQYKIPANKKYSLRFRISIK